MASTPAVMQAAMMRQAVAAGQTGTILTTWTTTWAPWKPRMLTMR